MLDTRADLIATYGICPTCREPFAPTVIRDEDGTPVEVRHVCSDGVTPAPDA